MVDGQRSGVLQQVRSVVAAQRTDPFSDRELLERFVAQRDEAAFTALVQRHGAMVLSVCRRLLHHAHDAEDAAQATFLVLVRQANAIRKKESIGSWLYGVAYRVSANLKRDLARRVKREGPAVDVPRADTTEEVAWRDVQVVLDAELMRLPEHYRAPLVLCYLAGKSRDEAAQELGWSIGTLRGRLERGRNLLRARLARRGFPLSAALLAVALAERAASAPLPAALAGALAKAATLLARGQAVTAQVVSTRVAALTEGVLEAMFLTPMKTLALSLLAVATLVVGGGMLLRTSEEKPQGDNRTAHFDEQPHLALLPRAPVSPDDRFGPEVKGLRARVTLGKDRFEVGEPILVEYVVKNVSKEEQTLWHSGFWPNHQILVKDQGGKEPPLTVVGRQCRKAFSPGGLREKNLPWPVPAGGEASAYQKYDLTKFYDLSKPGRYTVLYVYEEKQGGWEGRLPSNEAAFEVVAKKDEEQAASKPVRMEGLEFVAMLPKRITIPQPGGTRDVDLGLRITNVADKLQTISVFDVIRPRLFNLVDGIRMEVSIGRDGKPKAPPPVVLAPGASWTWKPRARLDVTTDRASLRLSGPDGLGVAGFWSITTLKAGKHRLSVEYTNNNPTQGAVPLWVGKATTEEVEFELVPTEEKKADVLIPSRPVQVDEVDFQAVVEPRRP
jgi:RNA polymerase sigma factor (sigma-70 family)